MDSIYNPQEKLRFHKKVSKGQLYIFFYQIDWNETLLFYNSVKGILRDVKAK